MIIGHAEAQNIAANFIGGLISETADAQSEIGGKVVNRFTMVGIDFDGMLVDFTQTIFIRVDMYENWDYEIAFGLTEVDAEYALFRAEEFRRAVRILSGLILVAGLED